MEKIKQIIIGAVLCFAIIALLFASFCAGYGVGYTNGLKEGYSLGSSDQQQIDAKHITSINQSVNGIQIGEIVKPSGGGGASLRDPSPIHKTYDRLPEDCGGILSVGMIYYHPPNLVTGWTSCSYSDLPIKFYHIVSSDGEGSTWVNASDGINDNGFWKWNN